MCPTAVPPEDPRSGGALDRPVAQLCSPPMPMIGIGEPVGRVVECLDQGPAVLVLDGGHPVGVLTDSLRRARLPRAARAAGRRVMADGFETRAIHAGQEPDPRTGAVVPPISLATTFAQDAVGRHRGYEYSRSGNPTRTSLEACLASLEGAAHGLAFASGLAAEGALLRTLAPGDHVVIPDDAHGGTYRLVARVHALQSVTWSAVDLTHVDALARAWRDETRLVWVETPTNPPLSVTDIAAVARFAGPRGARVVVDNTFATPYLQRPLELVAHAVVHSSSKYLGGHSDVVGGFVATSDDVLAERLRLLQNAVGACRRRSTATSCCAA